MFSAARLAMRVRVARLALPMWGTIRQFVSDSRGVVHRDRLRVGHVERGPGNLAVAQRLIQGALIDQPAPRHVDQKRGLLHQPKLRARQQVVGVRAERGVDAHKVGLPQQARQLDPHAAEALFGLPVPAPVGVEHPHVKTPGPLGDLSANPAQTDDAQGGVVDIAADKKERPPRLPAPVPAQTGRPRQCAGQCPESSQS